MSKSERLQKVMAHAGVASRRSSEVLIQQGRVTVNGKMITELGKKVDPQSDVIRVDGERIEIIQKHTYIALNKPQGYVTSVSDPSGLPTVRDLIDHSARIYPVGRLDVTSKGLVLLTDDGDLTHRLTHPSFEHDKEYHVLVRGQPSPRNLNRLRSGIRLEDGLTAPAEVEVLRNEVTRTRLRVVIHEGRKHQIRRMCEAIHHPVFQITRVRIGPIKLGNLESGHWRYLDQQEIKQLRNLVY